MYCKHPNHILYGRVPWQQPGWMPRRGKNVGLLLNPSDNAV